MQILSTKGGFTALGALKKETGPDRPAVWETDGAAAGGKYR